MRISKSLLAAVLVPAGALLVTACSPGPETPDGSETPGASGTPSDDGGDGGGPSQDECLIGTWQLDVQDVADQVVALTGIPGATAKADGPVTVVFDDDITVSYDATITITIPGAGTPIEATAVYTGSQVNTDWTTSDGMLTGTPGEGDFNIDMQLGESMPIDIPPPELGNVGVDSTYTCSGDSATVTGPSPAPTWRLTRV